MAFYDEISAIQEQLRYIGFDPRSSRNSPWYESIVISMLHRPGTRAAIEESAFAIFQAYQDAQAGNHHPDFHFGYARVRNYYLRGAGQAHKVGANHTFEEIEPYCHTHGRSYTGCETLGDPCDEACEYGMRFTAGRQPPAR
ncbi:MAG: hypothetical protein OXI25_08040 [Chloroflexota bacterium]|nr:hypothetical protein [Chloroflexota bacterium]